MKVKLLTGMAGADFSHQVGAEIEVEKKEGARLVEAGLAVPVVEKKERATRTPKEKR